MEYEKFLKSKMRTAPDCGFSVERSETNPKLFEWQKDIVIWALKKGRAGLFEDCGLGKTIQQLEWSDKVQKHCNLPVLIVAPLAVAEQTKREGLKFGYTVNICRTQKDVKDGINITNYEMLDHFDGSAFCGVVLDESSILKNFTGKVRTQIIDMFCKTPYKLSCTATPAPNDFMELGNQAEFLGVMSRTEMLATYFTHDGGETSKWRLKGHAEEKFWAWLATFAVVIGSPADLGYDSNGYDLPDLRMNEIQVDVEKEEVEVGENISFFVNTAETLSERRTARRNSMEKRCEAAANLCYKNPEEQWLIWCDLNSESEMLKEIIPGSVEIRGSNTVEEKTAALSGFSDGTVRRLITKPSIAGFGLNWQKCHNMIFVGVSDSYEMMYQAIRRCFRFGQEHTVNVYLVTSEAEQAVLENVLRKEKQCQMMKQKMVEHTKDILMEEIRGTVRIVIPYNPKVKMIIPEWLEVTA